MLYAIISVNGIVRTVEMTEGAFELQLDVAVTLPIRRQKSQKKYELKEDVQVLDYFTEEFVSFCKRSLLLFLSS